VFNGSLSVRQAASLCDLGEDAKAEELAKIDDEPEEVEPVKSRSETDADRNRTRFYDQVKKVCDGAIYTMETLPAALGVSKGGATPFIRMCDISPHVEVFRTYQNKVTLYQFCFDSESDSLGKQLAEYLKRIGNRADSSLQDRIDAEAALSILSRN
jgi:hypothetical protein